jgi:hypothetical protein
VILVPEWIIALRLRIKALFRRRQLDRDLHDELQFHLAMREQRDEWHSHSWLCFELPQYRAAQAGVPVPHPKDLRDRD